MRYEVKDDRQSCDRAALRYLVVAFDPMMTRWGRACGRCLKSLAAWATTAGDWHRVEAWVRRRGDMRRVRVVVVAEDATAAQIARACGATRPGTYLHLYEVQAGHAALGDG